MNEILLHWPLIATGFGVGLAVAVTGIGGGSLMTPILTGGFGVAGPVAIGTDLLYAGVSKGFASSLNAMRHRIDWRTVGTLLAGSLPMALVSFWVLNAWLDPATAKATVSRALGLALVVTGGSVVFGKPRPSAALPEQISSSQGEPVTDGLGRIWLVVAGAVVGTLTALSSVGAGALMMAVLLRAFPSRSPRDLVITDIAHAVPLTLVTGAAYASRGIYDASLLAWLLAGSLPGIALGTRVAHRLPAILFRQVLGVVLLALGIRYLLA